LSYELVFEVELASFPNFKMESKHVLVDVVEFIRSLVDVRCCLLYLLYAWDV